MKKQSGFTLIELIIVIVILGILAVTVAPQFFNFGSDARASTVRGMEGSVRAAADMVYARAAIAGVEGTTAAPETVTITGTSRPAGENETGVQIAYGYPTAAGLRDALNVNASTGEGEDTVTGDWNFTEAGTAVTITPEGFTPGNEGTCQVVYTQVTEAGARPTIETSTDGC